MKTENKKQIAIVDDDRDFLEIVREVLSDRYSVECFSSGEDILALLATLQPDLIILDVHMPGVDGVALCHQIRDDESLAATPVLFMTASREAKDFFRTVDAGSTAFINKPVDNEELFLKIRELLSE